MLTWHPLLTASQGACNHTYSTAGYFKVFYTSPWASAAVSGRDDARRRTAVNECPRDPTVTLKLSSSPLLAPPGTHLLRLRDVVISGQLLAVPHLGQNASDEGPPGPPEHFSGHHCYTLRWHP